MLDGVPDYSFQVLWSGPSKIAKVDLVVVPPKLVALFLDETIESINRWLLLTERANV